MTIKRETPYGFDPAFESMVVALTCSNPRFYGRVGYALDPELLRAEHTKLAVRAAHAIFKEVGHGPSRGLLVLQRLRAWMADGRVKLEDIKRLAVLFDDAEDSEPPDVESVIAELVPLVRQRIRDEAVQAAIDAYGKKGDLAKAVELERKAQRVGVVDTSIGTLLGTEESWVEVSSLQHMHRMPLGIPELDALLDGGLQRGGLGVLLGGSGDGKSMGLSHITGVNFCLGAFCGYVTLEVPKPEVVARVKANITGVPINVLKAGDTDEARTLFIRAAQRGGALVVTEMPGSATTVDDITQWVSAAEQMVGRTMDLLAVDYGDLVIVRSKREVSSYMHGKEVFEGLRAWAHDHKTWCWTASAATRRKDRKKRLDQDDVSDSMHKIKASDLTVTLNVAEEGEDRTITPFVAKHRTGKSRFAVGPFPTAYEIGQLVAL